MGSLIPVKTKLKLALRGLGLDLSHLDAFDSFLTRVKAHAIVGDLIPDEISDSVSVYKFVTSESFSLDSIIPQELSSFMRSVLSSDKGRRLAAKIIWQQAAKLPNNERLKLEEAMNALSDTQLLSERTEFTSIEEFISEAILPVAAAGLEEQTVQDGHTDMICTCPFCKNWFVPTK
jgi:hypothetical protein